MQDFESIAMGLVAGQQKKAAVRSHIKLSDSQLVQLMRTQQGDPLYEILLAIMSGVIEVLETEHLQHWKEKDLFDRTGIVAIAARMFYERVQREVNHHVEEYAGRVEADQQDKHAAEMTPADIVRLGFGMEK